ncbi:MAG: hypothetical protein ABSG01_09995 [Anaerolineales bacterium]|jgi:hypothetical protein
MNCPLCKFYSEAEGSEECLHDPPVRAFITGEFLGGWCFLFEPILPPKKPEKDLDTYEEDENFYE